MTQEFVDPSDIAAVVRNAYSTPKARAIYEQKAVACELRHWELSVVKATMGNDDRVRRVLAVGCGAGREVFALESMGFEVTGVDISAELIGVAMAEAARRGSNATLLLTSGNQLPFDCACFDAVVMWAQVLGHVPWASARAALLAEVRRVLRAGGVLSLSAHDRLLTRPLLEDARIVSADSPELGDFVITEPALGSISYMRYFDEPELLALVAGAGFGGISIAHTDALGESWGNVFVLMSVAV
jgi:SAM-dependent methyltransferase